MNQNSVGQQSKQEPKEFLDAYSAAKEAIIKKARIARDPSGYDRVANGAVGQTIQDNAQNYA